jgi:hypothetical protein
MFMNQSVPNDNPVREFRHHLPALSPDRYDLGAMLKENPWLCRILKVFRVSPEYLGLELIGLAKFDFHSPGLVVFIDCVNAVDYSIRPRDPACLGGAPPLEFHEQHPLLEKVSQIVPNSDGMETYDPPVKFGVLVMDQSYVIAGQFALRLEYVNEFKNESGMDEQQRQRTVAAFQRRLERMEPFRLRELKRFPTRIS